MRLGVLLRFSKSIKLSQSQLLLKEKLDKLSLELSEMGKKSENKGFFGFKRVINKDKSEKNTRGLYIYGGVGQGKTMLMDMFYDSVKAQKTRIHFHEFMIQVQRQLHSIKTRAGSSTDDSLLLVCDEILKKSRLLCLDEFHVTHISDAMILKELFTNLFNLGLVLVCTSNRAPEELYKNGLNRDRFVPFIPILYKFCDVYELNTQDFRQLSSASNHELLSANSPIDSERKYYMNRDIEALIGDYVKKMNLQRDNVREREVQITGLRKVRLPNCHERTVFLQFSDLYANNTFIGIEGLMRLTDEFNTFYLSNLPQFNTNLQYNNQLRIFIQFIDLLYEKLAPLTITFCRCRKLVLSTNNPLIYIFGPYGIIKLFDQFYSCIKETDLKLDQEMDLNGFKKLTNVNPNHMEKLFRSMLLPNETLLSSKRLSDIIKTHEELVNGNFPKNFTLYKLDISNEDEMNEDEFQCSRTLSRLFHMLSSSFVHNTE